MNILRISKYTAKKWGKKEERNKIKFAIHFHRPLVYHPNLHSSICPIEQFFWFL